MSVTAQPLSDNKDAAGASVQHTSGPESLLAALVYADLFDFPLTVEELQRYQVGTTLGLKEVTAALGDERVLKDTIRDKSGLYALRGREASILLRSLRRSRSRRLWPRARAYSRIASFLPFVRLIAVTGALAVENLGERPDIDFLVVAADGRVWICRRALILLVRLARLLGDDLCPNYIISEKNLTLDQRDFFTAHELAQMVPLVGREQYSRMIASNDWAASYLPCAFNRSEPQVPSSRPGVLKRLVEAVLRLKVFDRWEEWELARMRRQLRPLLGIAAEVVCSANQCKGHTGLHRRSVLTRFAAALVSRGLTGPLSIVEQQMDVKEI